MTCDLRRGSLKQASGFTLIEILVVIGVIAVLAGIIFPVMLSAKESGRQTTCLNNLGQLGKGIRLYADDWNGHFPIVRVMDGGDGNPRGNWAGVYRVRGKCDPILGQIYLYVRNVSIYLCPDDKGVKATNVDPITCSYPLSYSMNNLYDYRTSNVMESSRKVGLLIHEDRQSINDGDFSWLGWHNGLGGYDLPGKMHNGGTCILYSDLHAGWQKHKAVIQALQKGEWNP